MDAVTSHRSVSSDAHTLILIIKRNFTGSEFLGSIVTSLTYYNDARFDNIQHQVILSKPLSIVLCEKTSFLILGMLLHLLVSVIIFAYPAYLSNSNNITMFLTSLSIIVNSTE